MYEILLNQEVIIKVLNVYIIFFLKDKIGNGGIYLNPGVWEAEASRSLRA